MTDTSNTDLLKDGLKFLESALTNIIEIKGCTNGTALSNIVHGAIVFGESIYDKYSSEEKFTPESPKELPPTFYDDH